MYLDITPQEEGDAEVRKKNARQVALDFPVTRIMVQPELYGHGIEELDNVYPYDSVVEAYGAALIFNQLG
jgi:hypothetical protein